MQKLLFVFILSTGISVNSFAEYNLNNHCKDAWMLLMDLKIDEAKQILAEEIHSNKDNYYAYYLEQTCDAYALIINSNDEDYKLFIKNYEYRRDIMDGKDIDSPYYLACQSEMELQLGIFYILKGARLSGLRKAYLAYKDTYKNLKTFPNFKQSLKLDGFFKIAIANIPPFVKWAVSFFGVSSDVKYGTQLLKDNYESQKNIRGINMESALFVILGAKINKSPEDAYVFVNSLEGEITETFIYQYFKTNIDYRTGKNEEALQTLRQIKNRNSKYTEIMYSYLMGKVLLRKLDNQAEYYISSYIQNLDKQEYLKEMNYKLAIYYLIHDDKSKYKAYCKIVRQEGIDVNERDREALYDANLDYTPNVDLLKARLLLSGGYVKQADSILMSFKKSQLQLVAYQLEYHFLKAKLLLLKGEEQNAIYQLELVVKQGEKTDYYFASEAALVLGRIYRNCGQKDNAQKYFELSLKLYENNYYEYIEDAANKGLISLKN